MPHDLPLLPLTPQQIPKPNLQSLRLPEPSPEIKRMVRVQTCRLQSHGAMAGYLAELVGIRKAGMVR